MQHRWIIEQPAIRQGDIATLARTCTLCSKGYVGRWHQHILECDATRATWDRVDAVAATEWAALVAQDYGEAESIMEEVGHLWPRWLSQIRQICRQMCLNGRPILAPVLTSILMACRLNMNRM